MNAAHSRASASAPASREMPRDDPGDAPASPERARASESRERTPSSEIKIRSAAPQPESSSDDDAPKRPRDAASTPENVDADGADAATSPRAAKRGRRETDADAGGERDDGGDGDVAARANETRDADDDAPESPRGPIGEDPAVVAARNAARAGPSAEELERARRDEERRRLELERESEIITRSVECPASMVGRVIGRGGETIKSLQATSGAHVAIDQSGAEGEPRFVTISGPRRCVDVASELVENLLLGTGAAGGLLIVPGQITRSVECPKERVGKIIGRGGETIRGIQMATGARLQIDQTRQPCQVVMVGTDACVEACMQVVNEILEGGSTAVFNEIARGGQGFAYAAPSAAYAPAGWAAPAVAATSAHGAVDPSAAYAQQQAMYAQMYAAYAAAGGQQQYSHAAFEAVAAQPWRALDDGKGNTYYYNALTGVSQWEKPKELA